MRRLMTLLLVVMATALQAQERKDVRCLDFMGIPVEGPADHFVAALKEKGFTEWGASDDGEDLHFRGDFYGIRAKLMVSKVPDTRLVSSVYVTCGPYRTKSMIDRNFVYFLRKLQSDYGEFIVRNGAYYYMGTYGLIKMTQVDNDNGSRDIKVFFFNSSPYYKDAVLRGLKGNVQEVITENPIVESAMERYSRIGKLESSELTDRQYDLYGYLTHAVMKEESGQNSTVEYTYDESYRLVKRMLTNAAAGITYIHEYTYGDDDEVATLSQKVFDQHGECLLSINIDNHYEEHDEQGNWTRNTLRLLYWEKDMEGQPQPTTVTQTRSIRYWED